MTAKLLRELTAIPSVNPAFAPEGDPRAGEKKVGEFLAATAAKAGLDVDFQEVLPGRPNLVVRLAASGKARRRVLLAPHLDTVNGTDEQFTPRVEGNRLFARGACDTKGSVAAMIAAMAEVAASGKHPSETEILFVGLVDEEIGHAGAAAVVKARWKADLAIIGEPTQLQVVTAHKGALWLELRTKGKAAHGSCPERGRNAVLEMARVVEALETDYAAQLKRGKAHPLLGRGTVNVGSIRGGTQPNIVPASCVISVDRRTLPGETVKSVRAEMNAIFRKRGVKPEILETQSLYCGPMETDPNLPLARQFAKVAGQKRPVGVTFFCDGAVLEGGGIASVVFGPGNIAQAHTGDEWIDLREVDTASRMLTQFMRELP